MSLEDLAKALEKEIGKNHDNQEVTQWISTGFPNLNKALSGQLDGGYGFGRLYEIYGPSMAGKTALATEAMINAQQMGGVSIFIDYERSFDAGMAKEMGLNLDFPYFIYRKPQTWEEGNTIALKAIKAIRESSEIPKNAPILVISDSIAAAVPKSVFGKEFDELTMNDTTALSRVASTTLKSVAALCEKYDATAIYLNQIRTKPGVVYGDNSTTTGGMAMEFYASGRLSLTKAKIVDKTGGEDVFVGQMIKAKVTKSKHTRPFSVAEFRLTFGIDGSVNFDKVATLVEYLCKLGVLKKSGAYIMWEGNKVQTKRLIKQIHAKSEIGKLYELLPKGEIVEEISEEEDEE